jgi:GDP-4-dehydro-6-deoxy-D-mannose reductase
MRTVVVTGAQGYVGRHLVGQLRQEPVRVVGLGRSPPLTTFTYPIGAAGALAPLPQALDPRADDRYAYHSLDLTDPAATTAAMAALNPDIVIHLAGALRDETWSDLLRGNLTTTTVLLEALGRLKIRPRLIFASSGSVYGAQPAPPSAEDALPNPIGLYSCSKLIAEIAAQALCERFGLSLTIARLFNLVGPGLQPRHLLGRLAHEIAAIEHSGQPGRIATGALNATRDLIDVRDAARMLAALAWARQSPTIVNVASGIEISIREVAQRLITRARTRVMLQETAADAAPPGAERQAGDTRRANALGLSQQIPLDQSLEDTLAYARSLLTDQDR